MYAGQASDAPMGAISDRIQEARAAHGWTQAVLAEQAGVSRPTVARIERGDDVSTATLAKVAAALGLTVELMDQKPVELVRSRVALPEPEYLARIGELAYTVSSMEWKILGDLRRLADRLPESLTLAALEPQTTGAIGHRVAAAAEEVTDTDAKEYLLAVGRALSEAAELRNDVLHARPATHPEQDQRLTRAEVRSRQTTGARFWIDDGWFDNAVDRLNARLDEMNRVRPPFS